MAGPSATDKKVKFAFVHIMHCFQDPGGRKISTSVPQFLLVKHILENARNQGNFKQIKEIHLKMQIFLYYQARVGYVYMCVI